jgi:hypothetical protein
MLEVVSAKERREPSDIAIGLYRRGEAEPYETILKEVPKDFPAHLVPILSEFFCDGFETGVIYTEDPRLRIRRRKGRRHNPVVKNLGQVAATLHESGLSYGEVALQHCEKKSEPGHVCDKKCADRMRQRAQPFLGS